MHVSSSLWINSYPKEPQAARVKPGVLNPASPTTTSFSHLLHSSFEDTLFTLLQGGFEPGIEATLSRVSRRPYEHLGGPRHFSAGIQAAPLRASGRPALRASRRPYEHRGDPELTSISAARQPPTEVLILGAVIFIGEELFILATLVLCRAHKDMR